MILSRQTRDRFREERKARQMTQKQLAALADLSQAPISSLESGSISVSPETVRKVADYLGFNTETTPELLTAYHPGQWLTIEQAAESTGALAQAITELARAGRIPEALNPEPDLWLIPASYQQNTVRAVAIDLLTGLGDQYSSAETQDDHYTREFILYPGIAVFHTEKHPGKQNAIPFRSFLERLEDTGWQKVYESSLDGQNEGTLITIRTSGLKDSETRPGKHRITIISEADWTFTWTQPLPDSGWVSLMEKDEDTTLPQRELSSPLVLSQLGFGICYKKGAN